jgi:hypothetical protein
MILILIIILVIVAAGGMPTWGYHSYGYGPREALKEYL